MLNAVPLVVFLLLAQPQAAPKAPDERALLKARHAASARLVARNLVDVVRADIKKPNDRLGPALRRMYESELALAEVYRGQAALSYYRLAMLFWVAERHANDSAKFAYADFESIARYFAHDAEVEIARSGEKVAFTIEGVLCDLVKLAVAMAFDEPQPDDGTVPLTKEALTALERFAPEIGDSELERLLQKRAETANRNLNLRCQVLQAGAKGGTLAVAFDALGARLTAERELSGRASDQLQAHERAYTLAKWIEWICDRRFKVGQISQEDRDLARFHRLDQQIQWMRAKSAAKR